MAARTASIDRNEEMTSLSPYVLITEHTLRHTWPDLL